MKTKSNGQWRCASVARSCSGSAAIEFGLAIPLLVLILMGVVELGDTMYRAMQVYNSVEAGMLYAAKNGFDAAGISAAVVDATGTQGVTATPAPEQFCGCPTASGIIATTCNATCSGGGSPGQYARSARQCRARSSCPTRTALPSTLTAQSILRLN